MPHGRRWSKKPRPSEKNGYADVDPAVWKVERKSHGKEENVICSGN